MPPDESRVKEIQIASRKDLRYGVGLVVLLIAVSLTLFVLFDLRPRILFWIGLFYGTIRIIRGVRLRREARELEQFGFIKRERVQQGPQP